MDNELSRKIGNVILYHLYEHQIKDPDEIVKLIKESYTEAIEHLIKELVLVLPVSEATWRKKLQS